MHEDFMLSSTKAEQLEHVHITQKEKLIAKDLIRQGYLRKHDCRNLEKIHKQSFYKVHLPSHGVDALKSPNGCKYQLGQISGTNVYLGVAVRDSFCAAEACPCSSDNVCSSHLSLTCECPCTSPMDFNYCRSQFPNSSLPICPTFAPSGQPAQPPPSQNDCLNKCFDPRCAERNSSQWCDGIVSCYWCQKNKDSIPLNKPYCASSERCFRGIESATKKNEIDAECISTITPSTKQPSGNGLSTGAKVGIAVGCTILGILLVLVPLLILGIQRYRNSKDHKDTSTSTQDNAKTSPTVHSPVPDVLVRSTGIQNQAFRTYEDPDQMELPQWPPPYNEIQRAAEMPTTEQMSPVFNDEQPTLPEKQRKRRSSSNPVPPVPNTRRPSDTVAPRLRSVTDITQPPPVPNTRRPSDVTVPSMPRILSQSEANATRQMSTKRRQSEDSGRRPVEAQPPPLVPRMRRPSEGDTSKMRSDKSSPLNICGQTEQEKPVYSNIPPISEVKEQPNSENDDDDDADAEGYIECVSSSEDPRIN